MAISILYNGNPINGTAEDDFIFGIPGTAGTRHNTLNGNGGDDFILGDISSAWFATTSLANNGIPSAMSIDNFNVWTFDENPLFEDSTVSHTTVLVEATANQYEFFSFSVFAGQRITIDVDFGVSGIGVSTDVEILLYFNGSLVAQNEDENAAQSLFDPLLNYTAAAAGTYYVSIRPDDDSPFGGGETFILNVSVVGHPVGEPTIMGDDIIDGGAGDDYIAGVGGHDILNGGAGNDVIDGGSGIDIIDGGEGNDELFGRTGDDQINGGAGQDRIRGGAGFNTINGGDGDDLIIGGEGVDNVNAGAGNDTFTFTGLNPNIVEGVAGTDSILLNGGISNTLILIDLERGTTNFGARFTGFEDFVYNTSEFLQLIVLGTTGDNYIRVVQPEAAIFAGDGDDLVQASAGASVLDGGNGFDIIDFFALSAVSVDLASNRVSSGSLTCDSLIGFESAYGTSFADVLLGDAGGNYLKGREGNDVLNGGAGIDSTEGGPGDDIHYVDNAADTVFEFNGEGNDRVLASVSYQIFDGIREIEFLSTDSDQGTSAIDLTGNSISQQIVGNAGANQLRGLDGNDTLFGLAGNDFLDGGSGADLMNGGLGSDIYEVDNIGDVLVEAVGQGSDQVRSAIGYTLAAGVEIELLETTNRFLTTALDLTGNEFDNGVRGNDGANILTGGAGADILVGFGGNDTLDGGTGADTMSGGLGDDTFFVDDAADVLIEAVGQGFDGVVVSTSFVLTAGAEVELMTVSNGSDPFNLTGNEFANTLIANAAANMLDGGAGADVLSGLGGNDFYIVDNAGDSIIEATGGGVDYVGARSSYALAAGVQVETLSALEQGGLAALNFTGNEFAQDLIGNAGANNLDGGGGADRLIGLGGDDFYIVDNAGDSIVEFANDGNDYVAARVSYALTAGAQVETLSALEQGGLTAINLTGNAFGQDVIGNAGANVLAGGGGADRLIGLAGDDFYIVDSADDLVIEYANDGSDYVAARVSFVLGAGAHVETLSALEQGGTAALNLTGNTFGQDLIGNAGVNTLDGGGGADRLIGLGGDDFYVIDSADDAIVEFAGGGVDYVFARASWTLSAGAEVETVSTESHAATTAIDLNGNELANTMIGNNGANILNGRGGADRLVGLGGADAFVFNTALGGGNVDQILDYEIGVDKIILDDAVFAGLALGALSAGAFNTGSTASDADDRILYDAASGALFFDADGAGGAAAVQFAAVSAGLAMSANEFTVI